MKKYIQFSIKLFKATTIILLSFSLFSCKQELQEEKKVNAIQNFEKTEYYFLHPELEKKYCFTQAVRAGNIVKIMGVVSIDENGMVLGKNNFTEQMQNCYTDIDKILKHYGCTFEDVIVENYFTTNMNELHKNAINFRKRYYKEPYPTGTWIGVKELGSPDMMIEIEIEAVISNN